MPSSRLVIAIRILVVAVLLIATPILASRVSGGFGTTLATLVAVTTYAFLAGSLLDRTRTAVGPADLVTLVRGGLACGAAGYAVLVLRGEVPTQAWLIFAVAMLAVLLDGVDGAVARATGTQSRSGARLDAETDAALFLILSLIAAPLVGVWVLASGLLRYAFGLGVMVKPTWRRALPPRESRRVVAAIQGVVLASVFAPFIPVWLATTACALALALLVWSFGRDVVWLQRQAR
ncbi:CDP-alcohol phosphatidyltransferase family protein [Ornithinimicrobium sp. INDO-MA30-4]|uniref:CDP-alcohol phosphatidyltransferase family protein n=1 Tax=Ornithinimicrobium sp. INDO-MA30-4 TaxID=2908651 RepID=UPI001F39700C|nr:CDP-alcohol phosphatidyltransferase family protein [Ornithinimicrobium sp. INDO-MA30-4]UJH70875.1 CDP-alcohol phosphatidyltransferase family protein [Ornithinimicrobium sp. INDO-MA30-4]